MNALTAITQQPGARHLTAVCEAHGFTREHIRGWKKTHDRTAARRELWFRLLVLERSFSLPEAARIGRKDHTTALYGLRKIAFELMGTRPKARLCEIRATWDGEYYPALKAIAAFAEWGHAASQRE